MVFKETYVPIPLARSGRKTDVFNYETARKNPVGVVSGDINPICSAGCMELMAEKLNTCASNGQV